MRKTISLGETRGTTCSNVCVLGKGKLNIFK